MYNTWDIACKIFPFWAAAIVWLVWLLFRGEKPSKELAISSVRDFFSKLEQKEKELAISSKILHANQLQLEQELREKGKFIERVEYKESKPVFCENLTKTTNNILSNRNYILEGYRAYKESRKEVISKPISLIEEKTTHYDIELINIHQNNLRHRSANN